MSDDLKAQIDEVQKNYVEEGWYGIVTPSGWDQLILDTHNKIVEIAPTYKIHQVKQKFGGLRYYLGFSELHGDEEKMGWVRKIVAEAEARSYETCEYCGNDDFAAMHVTRTGYYCTACANCAIEGDLELLELDEDED